MEFKAKADRNLIRAQASSKRYVRVELRAPEAPPPSGAHAGEPGPGDRPLRIDVGHQDRDGAGGGGARHPDAAPRGSLQRGGLRHARSTCSCPRPKPHPRRAPRPSER